MKQLIQKKTVILLIIILFVASILRVWQLGSVPLSPDWDEVSLGYNAYSLMQTGKDEYGKVMPIVLQSFGDYKPGLYSYLSIPSISILGLNAFAVRLPSALIGIITVLATYFLVKELFSRETKQKGDKAGTIGLIAAGLLAISPWHIQFSRVAFETNVGLAFNIFGALFFLLGLRRHWLLIPSSLFFGLNLSVYQSERVFTPLIVLLLVFIYRKQLFSVSKKYLVTSIIVGILVVLPFLHFVVTNNEALSRAKSVSIFSQETEVTKKEKERFEKDRLHNEFLGSLFHHRRVVQAKNMISAYTSHYDLNWLFITGDIPRHHAPNMGLLYLWELPFLLIGIYLLLFSNYKKETKLLIFGWFLLAVVPAAVTKDVPHAVRTMNLLPTFQIFISSGLLSAIIFIHSLSLFKKRFVFVKLVLYLCFILVVGYNFAYYLNQYFVQQNYFHAKDWQYGYEELVSSVKQMEGSVDKIIVSDVTPLDQSYIFFLFYQKMSPAEYQKITNYNSSDYSRKIGKYEFRALNWEKDKSLTNVLLIGSEKDFPSEANLIKTIKNPDGTVAIEIVKQ